jgi:N-acetylglucosamine-6-phosphate deacetylase
VPGGATILGAHIEGPYLNPSKCGAQAAQHIRRADLGEAREWLDTGAVRLLALAPEYDENLRLLDECVRRGVTVSAAHTAATFEQVRAAAERGLSQATHTFNAMTPLGHREPGAAGAALALPQLRCELIADLVHVHPAVIKILLEAKGPAGVILITDSVRPAGLPAGEYRLDDRLVTLSDAVRLLDGTLAGSILTMNQALRHLRRATGRPLRELWPCASLNAARSIGAAAERGSLEVGKLADLVLVNDELDVGLTVVQGQVVFEAGWPPA